MAEDSVDISSGTVSGRVKRRGSKGNVVGDTTISRPVATPSARPVDATIMPSDDTALSSLAEGLSKASPGFEKYMNAKHDEFVKNEAIRAERMARIELMDKDEITEEILKGNLRPEDSPWFQEAYFKHGAVLQAQNTAQELRNKYDNEFDKDNGDINRFIRDNLKISERDLSDPDFAEPYLNALTDVETDIKKQQREYLSEKINLKKKTDIMLMIDNVVKEGVAEDKPLEWLKQNLNSMYVAGTEVFLTNQEVDEMVYSAVSASADNGNYNLIDYFLEPKPDGTPGLWYNPDFTDRINSLWDTSVKAHTKALDDRAKELKDIKTSDTNQVLLDIGAYVHTDPKGALQALSDPVLETMASETGNDGQLQTLRNTAIATIRANRSDYKDEQSATRTEVDEHLLYLVNVSIKLGKINTAAEVRQFFGAVNDQDYTKINGHYKDMLTAEKLLEGRNDEKYFGNKPQYKQRIDFIQKMLDPEGSAGKYSEEKYSDVDRQRSVKVTLAQLSFHDEVSALVANKGGWHLVDETDLQNIADNIIERNHFKNKSVERIVGGIEKGEWNKAGGLRDQYQRQFSPRFDSQPSFQRALDLAIKHGDTVEQESLKKEKRNHRSYYEQTWSPNI